MSDSDSDSVHSDTSVRSFLSETSAASSIETIMPTEREATTAKIRVRLPAFIADDPDLWFQQVEWALKNAGVQTSTEKFQCVGTSLEPRYAKEVRDLLLNPPDELQDPFKKLKDELLRRLGKS